MRKIKETYLIFVIIIGLFSLSIYSTYALFTEEYVVASLDINSKTYDISLSDVIEYRRINTYSNNDINITLNILNPTDKSMYYGLYTSKLEECIDIVHDENTSYVKDLIDVNISKTIVLKVSNKCSYNYSFNLYVLTDTDSFDDKDKIDDKYSIKNGNNDSIEKVKNEEVVENNNEVVEDNTLVSKIKTLFNDNNMEEVNINNENILYNSIVGLMKDSNDNIRYYGNNPNNYIKFNNELWRIIGLFNDNIKIIRNDSLDNNIYSDISNNFKASSIMKMINPNFTESNIFWNKIDKDSVSLLVKNDYYLGSVSLDDNSKNLYDSERDTKTIWNGYLGLIYPSDYIYSRDLRLCPNIIDLCDSYLNNNGYTISSIKDTSDKVFSVQDNSVISASIDSSLSIRPVGYLNNKVIVKDGNGTKDNPYVIDLK